MYNISFNASVLYNSVNVPFFPSAAPVLTLMLVILGKDFAPRRVPVAALQSASVLCNFSHLTEDDGEIYVYTGMVKLHNPLWNQIFLNPLQLGLFSAIFCHHHLFIEFMGKVAVLVIVQRTPPGKNKRCCISGTFEAGHRLLVAITG